MSNSPYTKEQIKVRNSNVACCYNCIHKCDDGNGEIICEILCHDKINNFGYVTPIDICDKYEKE